MRNLGLAIALGLGALALGGCAGQSTDQGDLTNEPTRKAHMVGVRESSDDSSETMKNVEHSLETGRSPLHPATGANLGPRPEPWMDEGEGDTSGPRPEPWRSDDDDSDGTNPPPSGSSSSGSTGTATGSGTGTGGSGSGGSSGGNPAK